MSVPLLHGYWRSTASYRVRIALGIKGIDFGQTTYDLRRNEQNSPGYRHLAPQGLVPALEADGTILTQSSAILEWIEERWPNPPLLPKDFGGRATVRAMSALIGCDVHPLNNLRVLNALRVRFSATPDQVQDWIVHWIDEGFAALELLVGIHGGRFAYGDDPTVADCYLVPQAYSAERFGMNLSSYPKLEAVIAEARALPSFQAAHPALQPDADPT